MRYASVSNQFGLGIGYTRSTIYGNYRHMIWLTYGYKSISWSWSRNPKATIAPRGE